MNICLLLLQSEHFHKFILLRVSGLKWCWCGFGQIGHLIIRAVAFSLWSKEVGHFIMCVQGEKCPLCH